MSAPVMVLAPVHSPQTKHCDCLGSGHPEYTDPECCICWKQPCSRGMTRMWRHLCAELIKELSPRVLVEVPF